MMENPATWGEAERVVQKAIRDWTLATEGGVIGVSMVACITDALRNHGLLPEEGEERNESSGAPQAGLRAEVVGDDLHEHLPVDSAEED